MTRLIEQAVELCVKVEMEARGISVTFGERVREGRTLGRS